jgi:hypothetical protein
MDLYFHAVSGVSILLRKLNWIYRNKAERTRALRLHYIRVIIARYIEQKILDKKTIRLFNI